jgi:ABC-type nickel/cobalt efflux system permease component RcnA
MIADTIIILGLGFLIGLEHAFEPDHVVAISSIISKGKNLKKTTIIGAIWGLGHTTTLFIAGIIILTLKITIPETIALSLEFLVGLIIIFLGFYVIKDVIENKKHIHKHTHDGTTHTHIHSHKVTDEHTHYHRSFSVGLIHGLAGSAALMLLILSTFNSLILGIIYILLFGIGSMVGMAIVGGIISIPFIYSSKKSRSIYTFIQYLTGFISIGFGSYLIFKIGYLEGLLF